MSTVEFNLLPDVKMAYVKAAKTRNLVIMVSVLVSAVALALLVVVFLGVDVVQKKQLSDADKAIATYTTQLKAIPSVNKIVTVQNQLQVLVGLHQSKHISSRIFTYLPAVTPTKAHVNSVKLDLAANTLEISGTADSHQTINTFIDTLKFTKYKIGNDSTAKTAFPSVLETAFSLDSNGTSASYTISATFDPALFANTPDGQAPVLVVPTLTSTRSVVEDPANTLFNGSIKASDSQKKTGN
jgi:Tfp pilus assembly protein PilN